MKNEYKVIAILYGKTIATVSNKEDALRIARDYTHRYGDIDILKNGKLFWSNNKY